MKITDGFTDNFKFKPGKSRRRLIARLVRNSQTPVLTCIRCESGVYLSSSEIPLCHACITDLTKPLDSRSFPR